MSYTTAVARPYAKALFSLSSEMATHKDWEIRLGLISNVLTDSYIASIMSNPTIDEKEKLSLLLSVCEQYLDEYSRNFIGVLSKYGRLTFVPEIYTIFKQYLNVFNGVVDVCVVTCGVVSDDVKRSLKDFVVQKFGVKANIKYEVDPYVVGGVVFKTENKIIDATFRDNLGRLRELFNKI